MKPTLSILHQVIKFDCSFLSIFRVLLICELDFRLKLALPPQINVLKVGLNYFQVHTTLKACFKSVKNVVFPYYAFWSTGQWGGYSLIAPLKLAEALPRLLSDHRLFI